MDENKIVIFSGAGVSAESGLKTFRDSDGLWENHNVEDVATPAAWRADPELVLRFYNERRAQAAKAEPNAAHLAIAALEARYEVVVITQNVDDLHERAGSSTVIHLHGELTKARSSAHPELIYDIGARPIALGEHCEQGSQLRPHIVWFGEAIQHSTPAREHIAGAGKVLVVGTSLTVYPAAGLLNKARHRAEKIIVSLDIEKKPYGFNWIRGKATHMVPHVVRCWMEGRRVS